MEYRVVPKVWPNRGRAYVRGDIVDDSMFPTGQAASWRRLGVLTEVTTTAAQLKQKTKKDLIVDAQTLGLDVSSKQPKSEIVDALAKEYQDGI